MTWYAKVSKKTLLGVQAGKQFIKYLPCQKYADRKWWLNFEIRPNLQSVNEHTAHKVIRVKLQNWHIDGMLIRKLLTRKNTFNEPMYSVSNAFENIHEKLDDYRSHFVSVYIFQNIGSRLLWISQVHFARQEISNEHTMSFVRQFRIFDFYIGIADLFGAGRRGQNWKEIRHFWSACFWYDRSRYICLPACTTKKCFLGALMVHTTRVPTH